MGTKTICAFLLLILSSKDGEKRIPKHGDENVTFPAFVGNRVSTVKKNTQTWGRKLKGDCNDGSRHVREKRIPKHGDENSGTTTTVVVVFPAVKKESPNMGTKTIRQ